MFTARRSTAFLLFAVFQFVALTVIAMQLYPHHRWTENFLSDLGATRTWYGEPNHRAPVLFVIAVVTLGFAMIGFATSWRDYAFARRRARGVGIASQICGTLSGLAFIGVACAPIDHALDLHNVLVVAAFGLLLMFAACATVVWWRNGAPLGVLVAGALYAAMLVAYFIAAGWATRDLYAHRHVLIVGQKIAVYASMAYVVYITLVIRRFNCAPA